MQGEIFHPETVPTKRCPKCQTDKSSLEFPRRKEGSSRPGSYCLSCQRAYCLDHYRANKEKHNQRRYRHQRKYLLRNRALLTEYLIAHACVDCGNNNPIVLEFDHVRGEKLYDVSTLARAAVSWGKIEAEI